MIDFSILTPEFIEQLNLQMDESTLHWTDYDKLNSALSSYIYYENDLDKLCSIFRGILMNHAFSNANKRTASMLVVNTLEMCGYSVDDSFMIKLCFDTIENHYEVSEIAERLKRHLGVETL